MQLVPDLTFLKQISDNDMDFIKDVLATFLDEMPKDMEALNTAIEHENFTDIGKIAHKTKSTLQTIGLLELKELALTIEQAIKKGSTEPMLLDQAKSFQQHITQTYPHIQQQINLSN